MIRSFLYICLIAGPLITGICLTGCNSGNEAGRAYYISPRGSDDNEGSLRNPWRTLERVNRMIMNHGDTILFEGGSVLSGTIYLDSIDSGDENGYVTIGSYGSGKAIIDGGNREGIIISNAEYFKIGNLIVRGNGRNTGNRTDGVLVRTSDYFSIDNLDVSGFQHSGIHIDGSRDAKLTGILAHDNGFAGIHVSGKRVNDPMIYENENLYIAGCKAYDNPGDPTVLNNHSGNGILASSVSGGTIEYCEAYNNGWDMPWTGNGPVGIWIWDCKNIKIQYCMSHDNKTNPVAADGGGFDFDGGVSNSLIQYCVSWSNQGAGFGLFEFGASKIWENNVVRYNISRNDGIRNGGSLSVWKGENGGTMRNCAIYNNTFYNDTAKGISLWLTTVPEGFTFTNNIFAFSGSFLGEKQRISGINLSGNCVWKISGNGYGIAAEQVNGIMSDPKLENPRMKIINDPRLIDQSSLSGFALKEGTPLSGTGEDPGSPFGFENNYIGINGYTIRHGSLFDIGAAGLERNER